MRFMAMNNESNKGYISFIIFKDINLESRAKDLMNELGINSVTTLEGKRGRVYIFKQEQLKLLEDSGISYRLLPEDKIEKYLTERGLNYLKNLR